MMEVLGMRMLKYNMITLSSHKKVNARNRGVTLIETMLYLALTGTVLVLLSGVGFVMQTTKAKTHSLEEVGYNVERVQEVLRKEVQKSVGVNTPTISNTSSMLSLEMASSSENPTEISLNEGVLQIKRGASATTSITTSSVLTTGLIFKNVSKDFSQHAVRSEVSIESYNPNDVTEYNASATFYSTTAKRK